MERFSVQLMNVEKKQTLSGNIDNICFEPYMCRDEPVDGVVEFHQNKHFPHLHIDDRWKSAARSPHNLHTDFPISYSIPRHIEDAHTKDVIVITKIEGFLCLHLHSMCH